LDCSLIRRPALLAENVTAPWPGYMKKLLVIKKVALESTLPPHNEGPCFSQLLHNPKSIRISRHLEVQDLTPVVADNEKTVQNTKRERLSGDALSELV